MGTTFVFFKFTRPTNNNKALGWMMERETLRGQCSKTARVMHPLWTALTFEDGSPLYWNRHSGAVSVHFPSASQLARGGILADAMVVFWEW